jgi:hypothetical protein
MDFSGNTKFFYSAGSFNFKGKKKNLDLVFKEFLYYLVSKLKFLKDKPVAVHLKNVGFKNFGL